MEQIKLTNGISFNLVPFNGITQSDKKLEMKLITDESLDELYKLFSNSDNLETIQILSEIDEIVGILSSYINLKEITRQKNVFLYKREIIEEDTNNDENAVTNTEDEVTKIETTSYEDIYGDITIVKLKTLDIEDEVKQQKKEIETLSLAITELSEMI